MGTPTQRERRIVAEVIDRFIQRDIDRRGIRDTFKPNSLSHGADALSELATALRLDHDGDDVELLNKAIDAVDANDDGRAELD